ncbi:gliding motility-associated lipoprotein GldJ [Mucilaginibacter yixingensis]|uniref:Gliding motility-associated lipoprotein GldJ n=1 Tax=Mucilaginibacter yixingensis TaxID=1295612 RepID=A0A2T5J875_9SPHI|nr:SUMF1/EgtB/PvdO family nonheme iron enzyme [Mucilaginibacter yixingensis]PTQ95655.1 gliding motility-associated lipoprotein GldJ [Mucilaginibacter yixingensis]
MKITFSRCAFVLLGSGLLLGACSQKPQSEKTGMEYNNKYNGGFQYFKNTHPAPGPGLVPIEGGTFVLGGSAGEDVNYEYNNIRKRKSISTFYMDETEVSNRNWCEYLYWLQINFPQDRELYYNAVPDTLVWRRPLSYNEPYVENYLRHAAFQDYPVVGVSWKQAQDYCDWRTQRMNENILRQQGRLVGWKDMAKDSTKGKSDPFNTDMYLNGQYKGAGKDGKHMIVDLNPLAKKDSSGKTPHRAVRLEDGIIRAGYRLPTEAEWEYAALGLAGNTQFENIEEGKVYPWNGMGVRSPKAKTRGLILANFKRGGGDNAGVGGYLNDKADITAPVRSYAPNDFGLYNMAGNVNEWVQDTYRQTSFEESDDFNPFRGNEFTDKQYSDPVKGIYAKDKYGRPVKAPAKAYKKMTWAEMVAQQNGGQPVAAQTQQANGAKAAPAAAGSTPQALATAKSPLVGKPYNPDARGMNDTVNTTLYGVTTLVNDHSKVYKGGSWNDRIYWLNPASRRFMDEEESSAEIGFRCAMSNVGGPEINPQGKPEFSVKKAKRFNPKN